MWIEDLRYAIRSFRTRPGLVAVVVLTLAVGIGAGTVIFSIVDQIVLKPLPFPASHRLVSFYSYYSRQSMRGAFSPPTFLDYRSRLESFQSVSATAPWNANLTGSGEAERVEAQQVSTNFFLTLGVSPSPGRGFLPEEEQPGKEHVVVLSNGLWKRHFGSDPEILGKTVMLNDVPYNIVGVMPPAFHWGMNYGKDSEASLWVPLALTADRIAEDQRGNEFLDLVGRLKDNTGREQAQAELDTVNRQLHARHPNYYLPDQGWVLQLRLLKDDMIAGIRPFLLLLLLAVGLMVLIACNNIAGLLLLRGVERQREIALRAALGADRFRLVRQILLECLLLAIAGGALGFLLGTWGLRAFLAVQGRALPRFAELGLDLHFLGFAAGLSLLCGALFGILPAFRLTAGSSSDALREGGRSLTQGPRRHRTVNALVVSQIALSLILLIASGLLLQSFRNLLAVDPGFRPEQIVTMTISQSPARHPKEQRADFLQQVLDRLRALPGVRSVSATSNLPMGGDQSSGTFYVEGRSQSPGEQMPQGDNWVVTPGYFQTMGIPLVSGRDFSEHDGAGSPQVVIVDQVLAERYWPGQNAIGKRMDFQGDGHTHVWCEVVGIVGQVKQRGLDEAARPEYYVPYRQMPLRLMSFVIRASAGAAPILDSVRHAVLAVDANQPVFRVETLPAILSGSVSERRLVATLMAGFALFAVFLTGLGLFGVLSTSVARRTHEIGIRMILGAAAGDVLALVLGETLKLTATGILLGLAGSVAATRFLASLLFQVKPLDPWIFALVAGILVAVALAAGFLPARRATSVQPAVALRQE